jgi:hypothetical protein
MGEGESCDRTTEGGDAVLGRENVESGEDKEGKEEAGTAAGSRHEAGEAGGWDHGRGKVGRSIVYF